MENAPREVKDLIEAIETLLEMLEEHGCKFEFIVGVSPEVYEAWRQQNAEK